MREFEMGKQFAQGDPESLSDATGFSGGEVAEAPEELRQVGVVDPCPFCSLTNSAPAQEPVQRRGHQDYEPTPGGAAQGRVPSPGGGEGEAGLRETDSEFGRALHGLEDSTVNNVLAAAWETMKRQARAHTLLRFDDAVVLGLMRAAVDILTAEAYRRGQQAGKVDMAKALLRVGVRPPKHTIEYWKNW